MWMFLALCFIAFAEVHSAWFNGVEIPCLSAGPSWKCNDRSQHCVPYYELCDGDKNCPEGEDEGEACGGHGEDRTCTDPLFGGKTGWRCRNGSQLCVQSRNVCDGDYAGSGCDDGEDEDCGGHGEDRKCTNPFTGEIDGWRCRTGRQQCVPSTQVCDTRKDCAEGEDEDEVCGGYGEDRIATNPVTGEAVGFRCKSGSQQFVHSRALCEGWISCKDGEDGGEICGGYGANRTCTNPITGKAVGWRCKSGSQECIMTIWLCNGRRDCDEGEDEDKNDVCHEENGMRDDYGLWIPL